MQGSQARLQVRPQDEFGKSSLQPETCNLKPTLFMCSNAGMNPGKRILAVDYGEKNIGFAYSDELGLTVQPLPSIPNMGQKNLIKRLRVMIRTLGVGELVLGMPVNMDGSIGDSAFRMGQLLEQLKNSLEIPTAAVDERLTTVEALEFWRGINPRRQKRYRTMDSLSAALILERYLKEK